MRHTNKQSRPSFRVFPGYPRFGASSSSRNDARRRELDKARGSATPDAVLEQEVEARDRADQEREVAPLRPATDAIIVATESKSVRQVFDEVMARLPKH